MKMNFKPTHLLSLGLLSLGSASAIAGMSDQELRSKLVDSPFPACKGVKLLSSKDYDSNKEAWKRLCQPGEKLMVMSGALDGVKSMVAELAFLEAATDRSIDGFDKKIAELSTAVSCFENPGKDGNCETIRKNHVNYAYDNLPRLRQELALAEGKDPEVKVHRAGSKLVFPSITDSVNRKLEKSFFGFGEGLDRPDDTPALSDAEAENAEKTYRNELALNFEKNEKNKSLSDQSKVALLKKLRALHASYYYTILANSPVLLGSGTLPDRNDTDAVNAKFAASIKKVLGWVKDQRDDMAKARKREVTSWNSKDGKVNGADIDLKQRALAGVFANPSLINQVIEEQMKVNPNVCAIATKLQSQVNTRKMVAGAFGAVGLIAGGVALTALAAPLDAVFLVIPEAVPLLGGAGLASTGVALTMGVGYGTYSRSYDKAELNKARGSFTSGQADAKVLEEKSNQVGFGEALMPLDLVGVGIFKAAGSQVYKSVATYALKQEKMSEGQMAKLFEAAREGNSESAKAARQTIAKAVVNRLSLPSNPTAQELELAQAAAEAGMAKDPGVVKQMFERMRNLQHQERTQVIQDTTAIMKNLKGNNVKSATPEQLKNLDRQIANVVVFGKVKDPKRIAAAMSTWDPQANEGLSTVYSDASKLMNDSQFMAGKSVQARREAAFKRALKNKGVTDPEAIQQMCECPGECAGGAKAALNEWTDEYLKSTGAHVCARDDKNVYFIPGKKS